MITDEYAAGFFDGEGSAYGNLRGKARPSPTIKASVPNTNKEVVYMFKERWGGSIHHKIHHQINWQDIYVWTLSSKQTRPFFGAILPHLVIKNEVVEWCVKYLDWMALPAHVRRDYSHTIDGIDPRTGKKRKYSKPLNRPEWESRRDEILAKIRALNSRGFNARRADTRAWEISALERLQANGEL